MKKLLLSLLLAGSAILGSQSVKAQDALIIKSHYNEAYLTETDPSKCYIGLPNDVTNQQNGQKLGIIGGPIYGPLPTQTGGSVYIGEQGLIAQVPERAGYKAYLKGMYIWAGERTKIIGDPDQFNLIVRNVQAASNGEIVPVGVVKAVPFTLEQIGSGPPFDLDFDPFIAKYFLPIAEAERPEVSGVLFFGIENYKPSFDDTLTFYYSATNATKHSGPCGQISLWSFLSYDTNTDEYKGAGNLNMLFGRTTTNYQIGAPMFFPLIEYRRIAEPNVTIVASSNDPVPCGESITLRGRAFNFTGENLTYSWTPTEGITNPTDSTITIKPKTNTTYTVSISDGTTTLTATASVSVRGADFGVNFTPTEPQRFTSLPQTVQFTNTTPNPDNFTYRWDFGDNTTSTEQNPSKTFTRAGNFTVTLEVTNKETGCKQSFSREGIVRLTNRPGVLPTHISIYPNPTEGRFALRYFGVQDLKVQAIDLSGRIVTESTIPFVSGNGGQYSIDFSNLNKGMYTLRITEGEHVYFHKLVIQ